MTQVIKSIPTNVPGFGIPMNELKISGSHSSKYYEALSELLSQGKINNLSTKNIDLIKVLMEESGDHIGFFFSHTRGRSGTGGDLGHFHQNLFHINNGRFSSFGFHFNHPNDIEKVLIKMQSTNISPAVIKIMEHGNAYAIGIKEKLFTAKDFEFLGDQQAQILFHSCMTGREFGPDLATRIKNTFYAPKYISEGLTSGEFDIIAPKSYLPYAIENGRLTIKEGHYVLEESNRNMDIGERYGIALNYNGNTQSSSKVQDLFYISDLHQS